MDRIRHPSIGRIAALWLGLGGMLWLGGCATVPEPIRNGKEASPDPAVVRAAPDQYADISIRWGGIITAVENRPGESVVEVVSRPLSDQARPRETDQSAGRFLARIPGFIDPAVYGLGRELTVVGQVEAMEQRNIGEFRYTYPVVRVTGHYLWPVRSPPMADPYYYSPFHPWPYYDPWYPYGRYPYRYPFP